MRIKASTILGLFVFSASYVFSQSESSEDSLVTYIFGDTIATIQVPNKYKENVWEYGEGVVVTLTYPDSSYILLHQGFLMSLPLLKSPEHLIYESKNLQGRVIRLGRIQYSKLRWREENIEIPNSLPINIAFSKVSRTKLKLFNKSLTSLRLHKIQ